MLFYPADPYIAAEVEEPTLAQRLQRRLVREGVAERRAIADRAVRQYEAKIGGGERQAPVIEEASNIVSFLVCLCHFSE